ncbi:protein kinase domain-containing protein [Nocardia sp. NPDC003345]
MTLAAGANFAGYRIIRPIGSGGMGSVYLAQHPRLPRHDAVKVLDETLAADAEFRARFEREAELAARLEHPNIVSIYDRGEENGRLWISMRFVDGVDASALVARGPAALPPSRAVEIVNQAARGLDTAHRRGLLHRDVKPANILVSAGDDGADIVRITDFGIARSLDAATDLTATGSVLATFAYAAPEQLSGRPVDHRADIYSLGCTLYELLTGSRPFGHRSGAAVIYAHLSEAPPRPSRARRELPPAMDEVVARAMAKEPAARFGSCAELATAARAALGAGPVPVTGPSRVSVGVSGGPPLPGDSAAGPVPRGPLGPADTSGAAGVSATIAPGTPQNGPAHPGHPRRPEDGTGGRSSRPTGRSPVGLRFAAGIALAAVVAGGGWIVLGGTADTVAGRPTTPATTPASTTSGPPTTTTTTPADSAWGPAAYIVAAFPGLLPPDPEATGYAGMRCALNDDLGAWLHCPTDDPAGFHVNVRCDPDRGPLAPSLESTGLVEFREQRWTRPSGTGTVRWGTDAYAGFGLLEVTFDDPGRSFCEVAASGGSGGRDVFDRWWADAPL